VRDHVVYQPHRYEDPSPVFFEPLGVLTAVGVSTQRIMLGSAAMIPHRHPVYLAQQLATLSHLVGPNRVILGLGLGRPTATELQALGLGEVIGPELHRECVDVLRGLWTGEKVDHDGFAYRFSGVNQHPTPRGGIPIWYCGNSLASARRAAEYCDGWIPSRLPTTSIARRTERLRRLAGEAGRRTPTTGATPITSPGRSIEEGAAKVNLPGLLRSLNADTQTVRPESGQFETAEDIEGALLAGPPDALVAGVERLHEAGVTHVSFDLRYRFADWEECVRLLGEEVLSRLPRSGSSSA
jgi:alkanesulfonate monooxygenase SsuD/methylene tetrahydromethanopterin reductase-like flavin-dependent oxidoreductase (luciferase family)